MVWRYGDEESRTVDVYKRQYEMRRHVTANEVYEFIKEAYPTIGKGTVYRLSLIHI